MHVGVSKRGSGLRLFRYVPFIGVFLVYGLLNAAPTQAATGINEQINFQGRLLNSSGATVPDGYYNIQFKIYQDGDGLSVGNTTGSPAGTLKWTENHLNNSSQGVQVKNGFMSVQLGAITAFGSSVDWNQNTLWLSMNIGSTNLTCTPFSSCTPDGEMVPMKRLSSTPYALNSGKLGGLTSSQFVQLGQGTQTDASNNSSIDINKTGSGNLITLQASSDTVFALTNAGNLMFGNNADHTLTVEAATTNIAGKSLTIAAGDAGTGATAHNGGGLTLQGGNAAGTSGNADGGSITLAGGTRSGSGTAGGVKVQNAADSANAFEVLTAGAAATFNVDTSNNIIKIGDNNGSDTAMTVFQLDSTTAAPTTNLSSKNGGLYYDTTGNDGLKGIINGSVVDICTTAAVCSGYGSTTGFIQLQSSSPGTAQTGHFNITGTGILTQLQTEDKSAASTNSSTLTIRTGNATGATSNSGSLTIDVGTATGTKGTITIGTTAAGITLVANTQIGSGTTDGTQTNLQLDSSNSSTDTGTCGLTTNQGALYYNTAMGSLRGCLNGNWVDVSNPDTLGLLTFGIIPSTGDDPYDLPSLITTGASGPCKVSWKTSTQVHVAPCVAYSGGHRVNVTAVDLNTNSGTAPHSNLTNAAPWGHVCLTGGTDSQPAFTNTAGTANPYANQPTFSISSPILCLASVKVATSGSAIIDDIYDVRTFSSTIKEAVNLTTLSDLGMLVDAASGGLVPSATCTTGTCSGKLYGVVIASNGSTSTTTPNAIVATVGPAFVKATAGTAGAFIKSGPTSGYAETNATIPNNAFYYSPGNTRTSWSTGCTSASTCQGSLYVSFIVR